MRREVIEARREMDRRNEERREKDTLLLVEIVQLSCVGGEDAYIGYIFLLSFFFLLSSLSHVRSSREHTTRCQIVRYPMWAQRYLLSDDPTELFYIDLHSTHLFRMNSELRKSVILLSCLSLAAVASALTFSNINSDGSRSEGGVGVRLDRRRHKRHQSRIRTSLPLFQSREDGDVTNMEYSTAFKAIMEQRYACTRFERFDGIKNSTTAASFPNATVVQMATQILDSSRRAPSGFNAQPYRCIVVSSPDAKEQLSRYCIGHNAHRVRDSDCTVVFLANREVFWDLSRIRNMIKDTNPKLFESKWKLWKYLALVLLFSQGIPLPKFLAGPISFMMRLTTSILAFFTRSKFPLPSLYSAEVWSQKNTMLFVMSYMLGCTANQLQTCPMEGYNVAGIRRMLQIPRRYTIPLIVATGKAYEYQSKFDDDAGVSHGPAVSDSIKDKRSTSTPRFPLKDVVFGDSYGSPLPQILKGTAAT